MSLGARQIEIQRCHTAHWDRPFGGKVCKKVGMEYYPEDSFGRFICCGEATELRSRLCMSYWDLPKVEILMGITFPSLTAASRMVYDNFKKRAWCAH